MNQNLWDVGLAIENEMLRTPSLSDENSNLCVKVGFNSNPKEDKRNQRLQSVTISS